MVIVKSGMKAVYRKAAKVAKGRGGVRLRENFVKRGAAEVAEGRAEW